MRGFHHYHMVFDFVFQTGKLGVRKVGKLNGRIVRSLVWALGSCL